MPPKKTTTPMTDEAIRALIAQGVADALAKHKANKSRNRDDSHDSESDGRRRMSVTRECTYTDFLKCQPLNLNGTEEVGRLTQWFEKMEFVFHISNYTVACQIKFATCTLQGNALTCWNSHVRTSIRTFAERQAKHKRKLDDDKQAQQQPPKKKNMARAYSAGSSEKKEYAGTLSLCNKYKFHHNGPCTVKCANRKRIGHLTRDCRSHVATNNQRTLTCYECGNQGHYITLELMLFKTSRKCTKGLLLLVEELELLVYINVYPDDPDMHALEEIIYLDNEEDVGAEADFSNLETIRIEAIRLFLAYASFMGFMVYQMDVKSAFLYGTIEEEVYVCQPPGFKDPDYPDKVYKVVKALYGLHQAPKAWYETLANYLLENGFQRRKIDQNLFIKKQKGNILLVQVYVDDIIFGSTNKELCKAFEKLMKDMFQMSSIRELTFFLGLQVKQKDNRSIIGSLMYLTLFIPDIMFDVCACACFQVTPKASHLHAVKRIFRYLKGKPYLGLWYPKDSPFNLVAYSDSDYAGASLDRKSTTEGCQFLGCRLISWQCKKHTVVATSSTEAEYVPAASCCAQVLWIQNQLLDYAKKVIITEDTIRQNLRLDDVDGIDCLPNEDIFVELARMGYEKPSTKLTFYKAFFLAQWKFLIHTIVQCMSAKRTAWNEFSSFMASAVICLATDMCYPDPKSWYLEQDKVAHALEIVKLKQRVRKLEKKKRTNHSGLKRLRKVGTAQRVESLNDTVMDDQEDASKQRGIAELDADKDVTLVDVDAEVEMDTNIQGRMAESQAKAYNLDLQHSEKVLSMQDTDKAQPTEVEEVLEVVTFVKLMTEVVTTVAPITTVAQVSKVNAPRRRMGVVIQDPEETSATSVIVHSEVQSKDKGKGILIEEPKPLKGQAQIDMDEAFARQLEAELNANINWNDVTEPIFEKHYNSNQVFLKRVKEEVLIQEKEIEEEESKRKGDSLEQKIAKKQRMDKEAEELKRHLQIVPNEDVYTEATPLASKLVKEIFEYTEPKNFSDDFLLNTLKIMFEKPNVEANVWRDKKSRYGLAKFSAVSINFDLTSIFSDSPLLGVNTPRSDEDRLKLIELMVILLQKGVCDEIRITTARLSSYYCQANVSAVWLLRWCCLVFIYIFQRSLNHLRIQTHKHTSPLLTPTSLSFSYHPYSLIMSSLFADTHNVVAILEKSDAAEGFDQIIDFLSGSYIHYALTVNPHIYISCIKQLWNTASVKRSGDVTRLQALVDKKKIVISEAVIREILQLNDAEGVV
nr:hypothetical protein [Tanacetum cinerariifolium]